MANFNAGIQYAQNATGVTGFTGAAPQTVAAAWLPMNDIAPYSLSANAYALATTSTLTVTGKWQVSNDQVTVYDAHLANNAANVAMATGTGSAVTQTHNIAAPSSVYGFRYARFVLVSGVGVGGGAAVDEGSISYNWMKRGYA